MTLTLPEIEAETAKMEKESKALKKDIYKIAWFMRGGISVEEILSMDVLDRDILAEIITENLSTTKESGLPFF